MRMDRVRELRQLFEFNMWANAAIMDAVSLLPEPEFMRDLGSSFPSIHDTVVHVMGAEWVWLQRWRGHSPGELPDGWLESPLPLIRQRWAAIEQERAAFLATLNEVDLDMVIEYR
ncbi:MAG: DinB family protein, partial [Longimicrobiales bacterium]